MTPGTRGPRRPAGPGAAELIGRLGLERNPEGGWFALTHTSPARLADGRPTASVIVYLLTREDPIGRLHRSDADSLHYHHFGGAVAIDCVVEPAGERSGSRRRRREILGGDLDRGQRLQVVVPGGWWKALELVEGPHALISEVVTPAWIPEDHQSAPADLLAGDPALAADLAWALSGEPAAGREPEGASVRVPEPDADELEARLGLERHLEGGAFRQTWESRRRVETAGGSRPLLNTIYYLLSRASPVGHFHRNASDITHFHHCGGPALYTLVLEDGTVREVALGRDLARGEVPSFTAPGGCWKSSRLGPGAGHCLISEAVSPGFDFADHAMATPETFSFLDPDTRARLARWVLR